jgi:hypothetical protein
MNRHSVRIAASKMKYLQKRATAHCGLVDALLSDVCNDISVSSTDHLHEQVGTLHQSRRTEQRGCSIGRRHCFGPSIRPLPCPPTSLQPPGARSPGSTYIERNIVPPLFTRNKAAKHRRIAISLCRNIWSFPIPCGRLLAANRGRGKCPPQYRGGARLRNSQVLRRPYWQPRVLAHRRGARHTAHASDITCFLKTWQTLQSPCFS